MTTATEPDVYVELTEDVSRIAAHFKFSTDDVNAVKKIKGRRWDPNGRFWHVPMDMKSARQLREIFGDRMQLGPAMRAWAKEQRKLERNLRSLGNADDANLLHTPQAILDVIAGRPIEHPTIPKGHVLRRTRPPRPYQRADIRMMALSNAINANDVGTGKTIEAIGAIYEAEINPMPVLVVAPRRTLVNVWQTEFARYAPDYKFWASEMPSQRAAYMNHLAVDLKSPQGHGVALIADDLRVEKYKDIKKDPEIQTEDPLHACRDYKGNWYRFKSETQRDFFQIEFGAVIIDEFHDVGLPNRNSLFSISVGLLKSRRRWPMSGTPIGGKPRRLWPVLNYIDPKKFSAEWAWIDDYLEVNVEQFYKKGDKGGRPSGTSRNVGGIADEEKFARDHKIHMIRRVKRDALPGLPDAVEILVPTPMDGRQLSEYNEFDQDHEIVIDGKRLSGSIVLSQYTRLRQLANSRLKFDGDKPIATTDSNKLPHLLERLAENGIRKTDWEPGARAYVGVNEVGFMEATAEVLRKAGIDVDVLHGGTKDSKPLLDKFSGPQEKPYVIVMTIKTGGTGLNLERAGSAHALDENWDPDIMHQFFGRGDRGARDTPLKQYTYRTPNSIQEYVAEVAEGKALNNKTVLGMARAIEALRRGEES